MALPANFITALGLNPISVNVIAEVALDGGVQKWGTHPGGFSDVRPVIKSIPTLTNKIDASRGFTRRGSIQLVISGLNTIRPLIQNFYLLNRRLTLKIGFNSSGYAYADYADIYAGKITDWSRKGDEITIVVSDDMFDADTKIPTEKADKTQTLDYTSNGVGQSPDTIINDILTSRLGIAAASVNTSNITNEVTTWLGGWKLHRVLTEPAAAKNFLAQLQRETMMYLFHAGTKIDGKVFAPALPGTVVEEWTDAHHIHKGFSQESGYKDNFYNRIIIYFDHDESGSTEPDNFQQWLIDNDTGSQSSAQHNEEKTLEIKSYWIRSKGWSQPTNITGVTIYHASIGNAIGAGTLTFVYSAGGEHTLQWTPPGGSIGGAEIISEAGKFNIVGTDGSQWVRVVVDYTLLPVANKSDTINITSLNGASNAATIARKMLNRYRDPAATVKFKVDIKEMAHSSEFLRPTDLKDLTTGESFEKGESEWTQERVLLTSVRPDFEKNILNIEAVETKFYQRYGFVAPAGQADYGAATVSEKERAYIGNASNKVAGGTIDGYVAW